MPGHLTALIAAILWLQATAVPTGDHTCTGVVKHPVNVLVNVTEPVTFRSYTWCLRVPPRCSKYTVQLKDRVKLHVEMHNKTITVCCEGYVEMEGRCVPACPPGADCPFMRCNRTNHCHCTPGYTGLYCNEACPRGLWGKDCKRPCDCPSGYTCHHLTGDCFVDDRPPRRTTTTTTTTTTTRPTTTITTPTTEGTTLETVKTPVFRFPPPPWVESAADSKKTTTRQVKKDESPPTKGMDVSQENPEVTTKKTLLEITLPTLATFQNQNITRIDRPTSIDLIPPLLNFEKENKNHTNDSTNIKGLETIEGLPTKSAVTTIPSKSAEKDESQIKDENSINKGTTMSKETTTPVPTTPTSEIHNTLQMHTVTLKTHSSINFTTKHQNNIQTLPTDTLVHTLLHSIHPGSTTTTTKLTDIVTQKPAKVPEKATTQQISYSTIPVENTFKNEIKTQTPDTSMNINKLVSTTTPEKIPTLDPNRSITPILFVPSNESPTTTKSTTKDDEYRVTTNGMTTVSDNQHQTTTPIFTKFTKSNHLEEKHFTTTFSDVETKTTFVPQTQNTPSNNNNQTAPVTEFNLAPFSFTTSKISSSTLIPKQEIPSNDLVSTTSTPSTSVNHLISETTMIHFPSLTNLTTEATTMSTSLTTPITTTKITNAPTTMKPLITSTTTAKLPTIASLNTSSQLTLATTTIPLTTAAEEVSTNYFTFSTTPTIITTPTTTVLTTKALTTEITTVTSPKTESPTTKIEFATSTYIAPNEISEKENNYSTGKPQIEETEPTTITTPTLAIEIIKDFNAHKKLKPDESLSSNAGQEKSKKKHEKIKPKNINTKEFPSIYQIKTEKHNETMMQQTTKITLRSILQAETFRNKVLTTSPTIIHPPQDSIDENYVTEDRPGIESVSSAPTPSKHNQIWYALKKHNFSNAEFKQQEPSGISEPSLVTTEMNRVLESNTIDYRQSSEEPVKKAMSKEEENYSLIFNKIKFNMTESIAEGVKLSREESSYFHLPMILVLGIALVTLLLLTLTLWVYLKRRRQRAEPFPPCIMAYAMEETPPMDCDSYDQAFFCPTFTNTYGEKINRELRELNYDHPRSSQPEPLYAEIFN